jgi:hypothetical protein
LGLRNTDPITKQEAIRSYEEAKKQVEAQSPGAPPAAGPGAGPEAHATAAPRAAVQVPRTQTAGSGPSGPRPGWPAKFKPDEGLYSYDTDGGERLSGVPVRSFPPVTRRAIIHRNTPQEWSDYHEFLEERKIWTNYRFGGPGRMTLSSRQYVQFYTEKQDRTIVFNPPLLNSPVPWHTGQSWKGSFDGKVYGTYTGRSELQKTTVGERQIEIWKDVLHVEMHGEVEGVVDVERWLSPETGLNIFEHYLATAQVEAFQYSAEWKVRIKSLEPEHS